MLRMCTNGFAPPIVRFMRLRWNIFREWHLLSYCGNGITPILQLDPVGFEPTLGLRRRIMSPVLSASEGRVRHGGLLPPAGHFHVDDDALHGKRAIADVDNLTATYVMLMVITPTVKPV